MIQFIISAPSKLSLFGEHTVKYGKTSLTAGINLRTTLTFTELSHLSLKNIIQIDFLQINLLLSIPLQQFLDFYRNCTFNEDNDELHDQVLQFYNHCPFRTEHHKAIARSFIYLLAYISHKENIDIKSFNIHLSTQLVIDENFICLASFTVCLAAALLRWSNLQKGAIDDFDINDLNKIYLYAIRCEQISHESGMADVAACTYGSIIRRTAGPILHYIPFFEMLNVKILLVDSKQTQNLEAQTQRLAELINKDSQTAYSIFGCIDGVTKLAANTLQKFGSIYTNNEFGLETKRLTLMMQYNFLLVSNLLEFHKMSFIIFFLFFVYFCVFHMFKTYFFIIYEFL